MRSIFVVFFVLVLSLGGKAQTTSSPPSTDGSQNGQTHGLGAGGTVFNTWGFMYRHHFANRFGFSTSIGGWLTTGYGYVGNELGMPITLSHRHYGWSALPEASIRIYLIPYLANIYRRNSWERDRTTNSLEIGLGAGPGAEFFFSKHFGIHAELPWMTFMRLANRKFAFHNSYPHFGGGLIYYF